MGRQSLPSYMLGTTKFGPHPTKEGERIVRAGFNDRAGRWRDWSGSGKTDAAALRALQKKVSEAQDKHQGGDDVLRHDTRLSRAGAIWLDWKARDGLSKRSLDDYRGYVRRCIDGTNMATLTVVQANDVAQIEAWLTVIADERGATAAVQARKVLSGILALAERRGAIPASVTARVRTPRPKADSIGDRKCKDDECDYDCGKRHLDTRRAFTEDEYVRVQAAADASPSDLGDLSAFLFTTGARISEALHCTSWSDVDLENSIVRVRGTKTEHADRTVTISADLTERLRSRAALHGTVGLVFGVTRYESKRGNPRDRNNVCKSLRLVFKEAEVQWAGTHSYRRTVASWLDANGASLAEIADQLGHGDINVTAQYLGRRTRPTRAAAVMVLPASANTNDAA